MTLALSRTSEPELARVEVPDRPIDSTTASRRRPAKDIVDEWGMQSFPASDPPANW